MNTPKKITAGTVLYRWKNGEPSPVTVTKVGRKYFYVEGDWGLSGRQFEIETLKDVNNYNIQLCRTQQEILDIQERARLEKELRDYFYPGNFLKKVSLEKLRAIAEVIKTGE